MFPPLQSELRSSRMTTSSRELTSRRIPTQYRRPPYTELKTTCVRVHLPSLWPAFFCCLLYMCAGVPAV
eukprot:9388062-Pyramimonas_sp.AAC.1